MFTGRTKPFRGDEPPLERLFTNFLSKATESYKERLWRTGHRWANHALRGLLNSVSTLSYPRQPASSAWTTASMLIDGFLPPKLVESRAKRGSRGVFVRSPQRIIVQGGIERLSDMQMLPQKPFYLKVLGGLGASFKKPPSVPPRTPTNPNLSSCLTIISQTINIVKKYRYILKTAQK